MRPYVKKYIERKRKRERESERGKRKKERKESKRVSETEREGRKAKEEEKVCGTANAPLCLGGRNTCAWIIFQPLVQSSSSSRSLYLANSARSVRINTIATKPDNRNTIIDEFAIANLREKRNGETHTHIDIEHTYRDT